MLQLRSHNRRSWDSGKCQIQKQASIFNKSVWFFHARDAIPPKKESQEVLLGKTLPKILKYFCQRYSSKISGNHYTKLLYLTQIGCAEKTIGDGRGLIGKLKILKAGLECFQKMIAQKSANLQNGYHKRDSNHRPICWKIKRWAY